MREKAIEQKISSTVRRQGGLALKLTSPSYAGLPDRLVLLPGGHIAFVELKAPGKKPKPLQSAVHQKLRALGFAVYVLDSDEKIGEIINEMLRR